MNTLIERIRSYGIRKPMSIIYKNHIIFIYSYGNIIYMGPISASDIMHIKVPYIQLVIDKIVSRRLKLVK